MDLFQIIRLTYMRKARLYAHAQALCPSTLSSRADFVPILLLAVSMRFSCATCGAEHDIDDISFGTDAPLQWDLLSEEERSRSLLGGDQCEIDSREGRSFYMRACLEI